MARLKIFPIRETVTTRRGETVRDALYRAGIDFDSPCNGQGVCGKCVVRALPPENAPETPHDDITDDQAAEGFRLACQLVPEHDLTIHLLSDYWEDDHRILEGARYLDADKDAKREWHAAHLVDQSELTAKPGNSPAARIGRREDEYVLAYEGEKSVNGIDWNDGAVEKGLAIDIGTTTMVVSLVRLRDGRELSTASSLNPQIKYGHDVMSRIQMGSTAEGLSELSECLQQTLGDLIDQVCEDSESDTLEIVDVVVGGNTTMLQLFARIDPSPLGSVPFTVGIEGGCTYPAEMFHLDVNPAARVYVPPIAHAFIGADISAGLLVCKGFFERGRHILFVDIGTNGEMGLSVDDRWYVTSTAAGPAFEGMGVSCGMRAHLGAVEAVSVNADGMTVHTIGNAPAKGICGSGIIDIVAALFTLGVIEASGRMRRPSEAAMLPEWAAERLLEIDDKAAFRIAEDVFFTQEDVRQVQLAKSAISAAIDILLDAAGIEAGQLKRIIIAGGFGFSLKTPSLETIGLLPSGTGEKVYFAGNTCRIGCVRLLGNIHNRSFIEDRMQKVNHLPIESRPDFMERYVDNMAFPEPGVAGEMRSIA